MRRLVEGCGRFSTHLAAAQVAYSIAACVQWFVVVPWLFRDARRLLARLLELAI